MVWKQTKHSNIQVHPQTSQHIIREEARNPMMYVDINPYTTDPYTNTIEH